MSTESISSSGSRSSRSTRRSSRRNSRRNSMRIISQPKSLNIKLNDLSRLVRDFQDAQDEDVKRVLTKQALDIEERIEEYSGELNDVDDKIIRERTKQGNLAVEEKRKLEEAKRNVKEVEKEAERKIKEAENKIKEAKKEAERKIKEAEKKIKEAERNISKAENRSTDLKQQRQDILNKIEETENLEVYFYDNLHPLLDNEDYDNT